MIPYNKLIAVFNIQNDRLISLRRTVARRRLLQMPVSSTLLTNVDEAQRRVHDLRTAVLARNRPFGFLLTL